MQLNWDNLLSTGIGAIIGSSLSLLGVWISHRLNRSHQENKDQQMILGVMQALHDEIESLWENYLQGVGNQIEVLPDDKPLALYWPVTQDYFTVYTTNAFFIGRIADHDLRKLIVSTYSKARGLIDSYRLNNDFFQKFEHAHWLFQETKNPAHEKSAKSQFMTLTNYAKSIKKAHEEVKKQVQDLLRALRKAGVLYRK